MVLTVKTVLFILSVMMAPAKSASLFALNCENPLFSSRIPVTAAGNCACTDLFNSPRLDENVPIAIFNPCIPASSWSTDSDNCPIASAGSLSFILVIVWSFSCIAGSWAVSVCAVCWNVFIDTLIAPISCWIAVVSIVGIVTLTSLAFSSPLNPSAG